MESDIEEEARRGELFVLESSQARLTPAAGPSGPSTGAPAGSRPDVQHFQRPLGSPPLLPSALIVLPPLTEPSRLK